MLPDIYSVQSQPKSGRQVHQPRKRAFARRRNDRCDDEISGRVPCNLHGKFWFCGYRTLHPGGNKGVLTADPGYEYAEGLKLQIKVGEKMEKRQYSKRDQFAAEISYFSECILIIASQNLQVRKVWRISA